MEFEEGLEKLLDGDAILFAGAGCSAGAVNLRGAPFLLGDALAKHLSDKTGISSTTPIEDAAEAFIEKFGAGALLREIQNEFTAKVIAEYHVKLGAIPWKRLYTTNYDNVLEEAYKANSKTLITITTGDIPSNIPRNEPACVHFNGYVSRLDLDKLGKELKLTNTSYLSNDIANSPWASTFRQDIRFARAVFFLGYSLHDLDITRILFDSPALKEKCFFILGKSPDETVIRRAKKFGRPYKNSISEFAEFVQKNTSHTNQL